MGPPCLEPPHFRHLHAALGHDAPPANTELGVVQSLEQLPRFLRTSYLPDGTAVRGVGVVETVWLGAPATTKEFVDALTSSRGDNVFADAL